MEATPMTAAGDLLDAWYLENYAGDAMVSQMLFRRKLQIQKGN